MEHETLVDLLLQRTHRDWDDYFVLRRELEDVTLDSAEEAVGKKNASARKAHSPPTDDYALRLKLFMQFQDLLLVQVGKLLLKLAQVRPAIPNRIKRSQQKK